jgi:hypothetical protein
MRSEWRRRAALVGKAAAGVLRASDPLGSARGVPAEVPRGSAGSGDRRRREIARAGRHTGGGSRSNSGHCWRRDRGWRPREASSRQGKATGGWAGAEVRRSGRSTARQEARCGGARR